MASLTDIRAALAAAVQAGVPNLQASPYPLSSPEPPTAHVVPDEIDYHLTFGEGGAEGWSFRVQVFFAYVEDEGSQRNADEFINDGTVRLALEDDPTLGGLVSDLIVDRAQFRMWEPEANRPMVGVEYFLRVLI